MLRRCCTLQVGLLLLLALSVSGCVSHAIDREIAMAAYADIPRELTKTSHPQYRVEPPDILQINAVTNIRPSDGAIEAGDEVFVRLETGKPFLIPEGLNPEDRPIEYQMALEREIENKVINGPFLVGADGKIDLGPSYGRVYIEGKSMEEAREELTAFFIENGLPDPRFTLTMPDVSGKQPILGEHLVRPDGTVALGVYGEVYVVGMTLPEVKDTLERHLSNYMHKPEVSVDVLAYNSKVVYVIMDGGGFGEQVVALPCTGSETVLDVIAKLEGLSQISSKKIWIARPGPSEYECAQVLDVHWRAITREGITTTNYQLFPGDRVYVQADRLMATDNFLSKVLAPMERLLGAIALGTGTAKGIKFFDTFRGTGGL